MNLDEWHDDAGRAAYESIAADLEPHPDAWADLAHESRERWRGVARAVLAEGRIEIRPPAVLAETETRAENDRLKGLLQDYHRSADEHVRKFDRKHADLISVQRQLDAVYEALALGEASDGYHTHNELYSFRLLYNVHAALAFDHAGWTVVRSWKHSDGKPCFDSPDWFVVHMETPAGQITNHYKRHYWRHFDGIAEAPTAPEWDGHTSEVATLRLEAAIEFLRQRLTEMSNHADLMKRAYARVCGERDKYMRRTVEWRDVAQNDTFRQNTTWLVEKIGREHIRQCEVEQCDTCSGVLGIEEKLQLLEDDDVRACTGCAGCGGCKP